MTSVSLLIQLVNIYPFPALPASLKDHVSAMPPIRETPEALSKQPHGRELFWEWGLKAAQKALKVLVKALVQ